ncbi:MULTISPECIES: glycosyltransferase family 2 protein [unclassified Bifidobacterium]|uniref:glycosyltransferase family 2 protein n=1 Tax=unclassified Bifidobacterium TaxID=2608897 RepID=UPI00112E251D|nr:MULTISPECIES: glycosyltransferase family 2 protein [unclassified Bifidobacterium]TPF78580.1 glycosyl transferase family 2 [Bifidobacterium sp. UTCIF-1]TPF80861.1 glycosyl transferase family 2 [Bifidobacterium sp. UTCIF-24]TPF82700.1 glycosyl transferase family 2 [Bifidobacterium sp. UTCIF-3]TPF84526.1 glycosyl transferase family 2 [Bifidobacterium sp. UTCIF-36]TPF90913.1 glycosyl transferase family 2 [Bifidobacterium sp. UTBIF-56]
MSNPRVSVIIPAYNAERSLKRCIESITNQTYCDIELIIVDDGSTDSTPSIADELAVEDSRIRVIHQTNGGVSKARNIGLDAANGIYVMFMDSDDWLDTNAIELMVDKSHQHNAEMCIAGYRSHFEDAEPGRKASAHQVADEKIVHVGNTTDAAELNAICDLEESLYLFQCWGKLYQRQWVGNLRFNEQVAYGEDTVFVFDALRHGPSTVVALPSALYEYSETQGGLASGFKLNKPQDIQWQHEQRLSFYQFGDLTAEHQLGLCRRLANDVLWALDAARRAPSSVGIPQRLRYIHLLADSPYRSYYLRGLRSAAASRIVKICYLLNSDILWRWFLGKE